MAGLNQFTEEGSPYEFASLRLATGHRKPRTSTEGAVIRVALLGGLLAFLLGGTWLLAGEKGQVMGTVAGPSQAPIPGARVALTAADGSRQFFVADQSGHYSFPSVEPGAYTLSAEAAGYQAATQNAVQVAGGASTTVNLHLVATAAPGAGPEPPAPSQPGYYDDTPLKASAVKTTIDSAGYSSQAQSPHRLMSEGPSLGGNPPKALPRGPGSPDAAAAEGDLQKALQDHPDSFEANHQLGEFYLSAGDLRTSIPCLEKAHKLKPEDYANGYDLAVAYLEAKSPGAAQTLLHDMLGRKDTAELHNLLGEADEALGDPTSAVKEYQLAAHMDPDEKYIFDWGNELLLHDTVEPALEVFERGAALYPNSSRMYIGLGIAYYSSNLYDKAIEALCHASDLSPSDPRPYLFLGKMYNVPAGKTDEIPKHLKRFMETNPNNALAYYYYALSSWKGARGSDQGVVDLAEVEALLRKSISLDPRLADAHLQLGALLHDQHRDQEAIPEFETAIRFKPDDPDAHYRLAQACARTGDKDRSQKEFQLYDKLHAQQVNETEKRR
ncbi:MAG: tetratricopeptide repeat protein [Terriglobia bacterium]